MSVLLPAPDGPINAMTVRNFQGHAFEGAITGPVLLYQTLKFQHYTPLTT